MTGFLKVSLAAAVAAGSILSVSAPASAEPGRGYGGGAHGDGGYRGAGYGPARGYGGGYQGGYGAGYGGYRGYGYGGFGAGALIGGLAGLAIGASVHGPYDRGYYGYGTCVAPQQVWNPYVGGYVIQQVPYPC
jgi:hypothetical protein